MAVGSQGKVPSDRVGGTDPAGNTHRGALGLTAAPAVVTKDRYAWQRAPRAAQARCNAPKTANRGEQAARGRGRTSAASMPRQCPATAAGSGRSPRPRRRAADFVRLARVASRCRPADRPAPSASEAHRCIGWLPAAHPGASAPGARCGYVRLPAACGDLALARELPPLFRRQLLILLPFFPDCLPLFRRQLL